MIPPLRNGIDRRCSGRDDRIGERGELQGLRVGVEETELERVARGVFHCGMVEACDTVRAEWRRGEAAAKQKQVR